MRSPLISPVGHQVGVVVTAIDPAMSLVNTVSLVWQCCAVFSLEKDKPVVSFSWSQKSFLFKFKTITLSIVHELLIEVQF